MGIVEVLEEDRDGVEDNKHVATLYTEKIPEKGYTIVLTNKF